MMTITFTVRDYSHATWPGSAQIFLTCHSLPQIKDDRRTVVVFKLRLCRLYIICGLRLHCNVLLDALWLYRPAINNSRTYACAYQRLCIKYASCVPYGSMKGRLSKTVRVITLHSSAIKCLLKIQIFWVVCALSTDQMCWIYCSTILIEHATVPSCQIGRTEECGTCARGKSKNGFMLYFVHNLMCSIQTRLRGTEMECVHGR
jgi:hypothetical protein